MNSINLNGQTRVNHEAKHCYSCSRKNTKIQIKKHLIYFLAQVWRDQGHTVKFIFGINEYTPADICIVHVDLSLVPDNYLEIAHRYPVVLNGEIRDIRKSTISKNLVLSTSDYDGPVLVKTNYNYAGWPEKAIESNLLSLLLSSAARKFSRTSANIMSQQQYQYYSSADAVPAHFYSNESFVVEKFLPEMSEDLYCVNFLKFFGDAHLCAKLYSKRRVVTDAVEVKRESIEPHPEILQIRDELKIDFGKLDYCMVDGKAVLLDVNKTSGLASRKVSEDDWKIFRVRAAGLNLYL